MPVDDWDDLRFVLAIGRAGSLAGAARDLGVNQTTVTRRLTQLEERVQLRLFDRRRGGVSTTPAGAAFVETAEALEEQVFALDRRVAGRELQLVGDVRLAIPQLLAAAWTRQLAGFKSAHPGLELTVNAGTEIASLSRREADVALRICATPPEHLVGRRLGRLAVGLYGASRFVGQPLDAVPWLGWNPADWPSAAVEQFRARHAPKGSYAFFLNDYTVLIESLRAGVGASILPCVLADPDPTLHRLTPPDLLPASVWLLTHPDLRHSPRVRALMDYLYALLAEQGDALEGRGPQASGAPLA